MTDEDEKKALQKVQRKLNAMSLGPGVANALSTRCWRVRGVYWSRVCIALHLAPRITPDELAKTELYRLLRSVWQGVLQCDLARPVVAFVSSGDDQPLEQCEYEILSHWAAEQNWHQGHFCLYAEHPRLRSGGKDSAPMTTEQLLLDCLAHSPQEIEETDWRDFETILRVMRAGCDPHQTGLSELVDLLGREWSLAAENTEGEPDHDPFATWMEEILQEEESLHAGGQRT